MRTMCVLMHMRNRTLKLLYRLRHWNSYFRNSIASASFVKLLSKNRPVGPTVRANVPAIALVPTLDDFQQESPHVESSIYHALPITPYAAKRVGGIGASPSGHWASPYSAHNAYEHMARRTAWGLFNYRNQRHMAALEPFEAFQLPAGRVATQAMLNLLFNISRSS
jgi:hypothetical protein